MMSDRFQIIVDNRVAKKEATLKGAVYEAAKILDRNAGNQVKLEIVDLSCHIYREAEIKELRNRILNHGQHHNSEEKQGIICIYFG